MVNTLAEFINATTKNSQIKHCTYLKYAAIHTPNL